MFGSISVNGSFFMKNFFSKYSYAMVKMFVTQFAIGLFGAVLSFAVSSFSGNDSTTLSGTEKTLLIAVSAFSILFYLFLTYTTIWEIGAKDKISADVGKLKIKPWLGIIISLFANLPNLIVAVIYSVCWFVSHGAEGTATNIAAFMKIIVLFIDGMYYGLLAAVGVGSELLINQWWSLFLIILPAIFVCGVGYFLGTKDFHLTSMAQPLYPESDRDEKSKKFSIKK